MTTDRIPVSTERTGCIPFNRGQQGKAGYKVGENPVKENGEYVESFEDALQRLRAMNNPGWRDFGQGNSQSAHRAIAWISPEDAARLMAETDKNQRVALFKSLSDVVLV